MRTSFFAGPDDFIGPDDVTESALADLRFARMLFLKARADPRVFSAVIVFRSKYGRRATRRGIVARTSSSEYPRQPQLASCQFGVGKVGDELSSVRPFGGGRTVRVYKNPHSRLVRSVY